MINPAWQVCNTGELLRPGEVANPNPNLNPNLNPNPNPNPSSSPNPNPNPNPKPNPNPNQVEAALKEVDHPFVGFLQARLARFRSLFSEESPLPTGFIHGDAFLDN